MPARLITGLAIACALVVAAMVSVPGLAVAVADSPDRCADAPTVQPDTSLSETFASADDDDAVKMRLDEGDHVAMSALVPAAEEEFQIRISSDAEFTIKRVENAEWDSRRHELDGIDGGFEATWEVWAEEDAVICFRLSDNAGAVPYEWTLSSTHRPATHADSWADQEADARRIDPNGTYEGRIDTPNDNDVMQIRLAEGDHVDMSALVPAAESQFQAWITSESKITVKNVSNAEWDSRRHELDNVDGGFEATWEVWAEEDAVVTIELFEHSHDGEVPYRWELTVERTPATHADSWADREADARRIDPNGTYEERIDTPGDDDVMRIRLEEGDHVDMSALVPTAESRFQAWITSESKITVKNVSNAEWDPRRHELDTITGDRRAAWEVWAEEDAVVTIELFEHSHEGVVPYRWELTSRRTPARFADSWADRESDAQRIDPTGTYSGHIDTPSDDDVMKIALREGDYVDVSLFVPAAEDRFQAWITSESEIAVEQVSNAEWDARRHELDSITGGIVAEWEIHAEENAIVTVTLFEYSRDGTVPYRWSMSTRKNAQLDDNLAPTAEFTARPAAPSAGEPLTFDAARSSDPDGSIAAYEWDLDSDGTVDARGRTVTHVYDSPGTVTAELTVTDDRGASATSTETVTVQAANRPPTAHFEVEPTSPKPGETVTFDADGSEDADGSVASYQWDWDGDGVADATGASVTHAFEAAGDRTVTLTVTDDAGASDTVTRSVSVSQPVADPVTASRSVPDRVTPGETATVTTTIEIPSPTDRVSLAERFAPAFERVSVTDASVTAGSGSVITNLAEPDGVDAAVTGVSADSTIQITYEVRVGATITTGTTYTISGTVTAGGSVIATGNDTLTVSEAGALGRFANRNGVIDTNGLRQAISDWALGEVDTQVLREVISTWATGESVT